MFTQSIMIRGAFALGLVMLTSTAAFAQSASSRQLPATASNTVPLPLVRDSAAVAAERAKTQLLLAQIAKKGGAALAAHSPRTANSNASTAQLNSTSELVANGYRAYPPSCLSLDSTYSLPSAVTGPYSSTNVDLAEFDPNTQAYVRETVTIYVWRVACSSSGNVYNSATLMRIQRQSAYEGDATLFPLFPSVRMAQGSVGFDNTSGLDFIRLGIEPNTVISTVYADTPVIYSTTYVLEYFANDAYNVQNFNNAFSLRFNNFFSTNNYYYSGVVSAYAPNSATYPAAFQPQPLSGYLSGNFFDPNHSGEGINIEVDELPSGSRYLFFAWFTFDDLGLPYWISGSNTFNDGDTSVTVPTGYSTNGGFAGSFGASSNTQLWGNVTFTFPNCNEVTMNYASVAGLPAHVPTGSNVLNWQRLTSLNGLTCE